MNEILKTVGRLNMSMLMFIKLYMQLAKMMNLVYIICKIKPLKIGQ